MTLSKARILSSETDNTIKQDQNTNVNIKITKPPSQNVNFTQPPAPQRGESQIYHPGQTSNSTMQQIPNLPLDLQSTDSQFLSQPQISSPAQFSEDRGIADIGAEINDLEKKNRFLEMIVQMYETNPLKVNSYIVCDNKLLMNMIKLLTECDKVELVLDDSDVGCGCTSSSSKFNKVAKILITKDGKTEDFKYCYNDIYSQFVKYGLSLKLVI